MNPQHPVTRIRLIGISLSMLMPVLSWCHDVVAVTRRQLIHPEPSGQAVLPIARRSFVSLG